MKKILLFLLLFSAFTPTFGSETTNYNSNKTVTQNQKKEQSDYKYFKEDSTAQEGQKETLTDEEKQHNFFMRTSMLIIGTFIFFFVLFLVFRMKSK
ncbi:MAG: hypothetical protein CMP67_02730 [Flavobacteriales bacterium]|nr:hypothetical protein [Flavobacteriales bacterium]|tara:strand:+ start:84 stop:371 length:288 start_codon:yes stop_codon:yes gene_type:complete